MKQFIENLISDLENWIVCIQDIDESCIIREWIYDWFDYYQNTEDRMKMIRLYDKLIEEETCEIKEAVFNQDLFEILDGIIDKLWVEAWQDFFIYWYRWLGITIWRFEKICQYLPEDLIKLWILEVAYSNWTKSLEKQKDWEKVWKIIKGPNFKKPDWNRVFKLYKKFYEKNSTTNS